jgi:hypothetical protein
MDKKSKIVIIIFIVMALVSIFLTYKRVFINHNYAVIEE